MKDYETFKKWYTDEVTQYIKENPNDEYWAEEAMLWLHRVCPPWDMKNSEGVVDLIRISDIFSQLVSLRPLTALNDPGKNEEEWEMVEENVYRNRRYWPLFYMKNVLGTDMFCDYNRFEFVDISDGKKINPNIFNRDFICMFLSMTEPITFPYLPKRQKDKVYVAFYKSNVKEEIIAHIGYIRNPDEEFETITVNQYFRIRKDDRFPVPIKREEAASYIVGRM